jgi:hypothetical protein
MPLRARLAKVEYPVGVVVCETPAQLSPTSHDGLGLKNDDTP